MRSQNDVYMVFQKAITMNSQDTVPFREVSSLAKLLLMVPAQCNNSKATDKVLLDFCRPWRC